MGAFERDPSRIADTLAAWLGPERSEFEAMAKRAKAIGKTWQNALFRIVEDLAAMVREGDTAAEKPGHNRHFSWELEAA